MIFIKNDCVLQPFFLLFRIRHLWERVVEHEFGSKDSGAFTVRDDSYAMYCILHDLAFNSLFIRFRRFPVRAPDFIRHGGVVKHHRALYKRGKGGYRAFSIGIYPSQQTLKVFTKRLSFPSAGAPLLSR